MIAFVGIPPLLRMALQIAMVTRFIFEEHFFSHSVVPGNNLAPMINCPGVQGMSK